MKNERTVSRRLKRAIVFAIAFVMTLLIVQASDVTAAITGNAYNLTVGELKNVPCATMSVFKFSPSEDGYYKGKFYPASSTTAVYAINNADEEESLATGTVEALKDTKTVYLTAGVKYEYIVQMDTFDKNSTFAVKIEKTTAPTDDNEEEREIIQNCFRSFYQINGGEKYYNEYGDTPFWVEEASLGDRITLGYEMIKTPSEPYQVKFFNYYDNAAVENKETELSSGNLTYTFTKGQERKEIIAYIFDSRGLERVREDFYAKFEQTLSGTVYINNKKYIYIHHSNGDLYSKDIAVKKGNRVTIKVDPVSTYKNKKYIYTWYDSNYNIVKENDNTYTYTKGSGTDTFRLFFADGCAFWDVRINVYEDSSSSEPVPKKTESVKVTVSKNTTLPLQMGQQTKAVQITSLKKGDTVKNWTSSNTKIATVSKTGKNPTIKAGKKSGIAIIRLVTKKGDTYTFKVKVSKKRVNTTKISISKKAITLKNGKKYILKPNVAPITTQDKITYKSSNSKIVAVSKKGVLTAKKKKGKAIITIKSGKKLIKVKVTVK